MRVNELSKELGRTNKEVLAFLKEKGVDGITHSSNVTSEQAQMVRNHFGSSGAGGVAQAGAAKASGRKEQPESKAEKAENKSEKAESKPEKAESKSDKSESRAKEPESKAREQAKTGAEAADRPQEKPQSGQTSEPQPVKTDRARTETAPEGGARQEDKPVAQEGQRSTEQAAPPEEPKKKRFTAVFRPQNAQQQSRHNRPQQPGQTRGGQAGGRYTQVTQPAGAPQQTGSQQARPAAQTGKKPDMPQTAKPEDKTAQTQVASAQTQSAQSAHTSQAQVQSAQSTHTSDTQVQAAPKTAPTSGDAAQKPAQSTQPHDTSAQDAAASGSSAQAAAPKQDTPATHKAPLLEGRTSVTKLGNIFANLKPRTTTSDASTAQGGRNAGSRSGDRRGFDNRGGDRRGTQGGYQGQRGAGGAQGGRTGGQRGYIVNGQRQTGANQGQRPAPGAGGQRFSRDNRTARPGDPSGRRPFGGAQAGAGAVSGDFSKKNAGQKQTRNSYKDKNDKRHRTEDGPVKTGGRVSKHPFIKPAAKPAEVVEEIKEITIPESITIRDLADRMKLQAAAIIKDLFMKGEIVTVNTEITYEKAEEIALEHDILCSKEEKINVIAELLKEDEEDEASMVERPPVVCVMGHVDHGKTSLLDKIRQTNVTSHEAGGITQAIGAYQVKINDRMITFLDTPGHEAFTAMRMRGAQSTDIAVLVVAADDGVMPQTIEAINHAKAADVDIVVAVNKIDKPDANIDRVKQELSEQGVIPEDWGGTTPFCPVSAKTGEGIETLLEMILLTADIDELKANPNRLARGIVIEAKLDKGRGPVATVLVQKGTLNVGDFIAAGACSGKVRAMVNDKGQRVKSATPSTPVEILGLDKVPEAGEVFVATETDKDAKDFAATFIAENKNKLLEETKAKMSLDDLFSQIQAGNVKELPIIVKADVQGSVEAVRTSLVKLSNDEVQAKVIHGAVGAISESDVNLASASGAIIIGFNVKPDATAKATAEREKVEIKLYNVIYQAIDDVERAMKGMLAPVYEEKVIGHAVIRQIFKASDVGNIAGSYILDGQLQRDCKIRITREGEQVYEGSLASLKRFKDDVKEVKAGYECGLVFDGFNDIQVEDQIEGYIMVEVPRS